MSTAIATPDCYPTVLEPFPAFIDSKPTMSSFLRSKMSYLQLMSPSSTVSQLTGKISMPSKVTNYVRLRYYQYEVTFGLYVMTPNEKLVLNTILLGIIAALTWAVVFGLEPFLVRSLCRLVYYITGTLEGTDNVCT